MKSKYCVIIPTFNNNLTLGKVMDDILKITEDIIVVNDGSTDNTLDVLKDHHSLHVISYTINRGKGYAIKKGFSFALENGFEYAITIDADGQHHADEIQLFVDEIENEPDALIVGSRELNKQKLSLGSSFANKFSNFWFRFVTGVKLSDTQSGFRLYPLKLLSPLKLFTNRYEFELETLVRAAWRGINIKSIPIQVFYPASKNRVSHFRPFRDFMRITLLNTVLVLISLLYIKPFYFIRYLNRDTITAFIKKQIIHTQDSPVKTTFSVMFGVFMGVVPIWGYQLVTAIALAYLFRLNKFIVIVASNISIPPMIPFILYASYVTGGWILQPEQQITYRTSDLTLEFVKNNLYQYVVGSMVFAVILAFCFGLLTYVMLRLLKKKTVLTD